jgi:hypothetical protein
MAIGFVKAAAGLTMAAASVGWSTWGTTKAGLDQGNVFVLHCKKKDTAPEKHLEKKIMTTALAIGSIYCSNLLQDLASNCSPLIKRRRKSLRRLNAFLQPSCYIGTFIKTTGTSRLTKDPKTAAKRYFVDTLGLWGAVKKAQTIITG